MAAIDERYLRMFVEEARELLVDLEDGLINLESRRGDRSHLDKTFRAAHSIKGAAAMVGLGAVAEFTHGIEAVLDRLREGTLPVTPAMITTLLAARDHLALSVEAESAHTPIPTAIDLAGRVERLLVDDPGPEEPATPFSAETAGRSPPSRSVAYRISLVPGAETLRRGLNPMGVLDELRELGATRIQTDPGSVPPLATIDPERCYLSWSIELETEATREQLDEVFLFVSEDASITIEVNPGAGESLSPDPVELASVAHPIPEPPTRVPKPEPIETATATVVRLSPRIRVEAGQLDDLVGLAGELAVLSDNLQGFREPDGAKPWDATLEALDRVSRLIRDTTLELRMVPVEELFSRFPRVVRDLAVSSGKEIDLKIVGGDTRLDRTIIERLSDPMIHLIRNAVDHALETPAERLAAGKSRTGTITLRAGHEGDRVAIRVEDDGRGLDRGAILRRGIARGLVPDGTSIDDPRVGTLIFEPGFSTRDAVSELSGRGVGLDVVRDAVRALRGSLGVDSQPGKGTRFVFQLPLTLALIDGLLVEIGGDRYVVPLAQVEECVAADESMRALARGRACVAIRGELVPVVPLRERFGAGREKPEREEILLTRYAGQRVGVAVDRLLGRVQAVIQSLGAGLSSIGRFSGATILADGSVSLILDLAALVSEARAEENRVPPPAAGVTSEVLR